jgi:mono/diheme cytochrome c family protein
MPRARVRRDDGCHEDPTRRTIQRGEEMRERLVLRGHLIDYGLLVVACLGLVAVVSGLVTPSSAGRADLTVPTIVRVTAGKPTEYAFKLSRSSSLPWNAAKGSSTVTFKVCTAPLEGVLVNACVGKATPSLAPARTASLTVTFNARGTYEYLSNLPGQAAKGMKGMVGIGVALPKTPATTTPTIPKTTAPTTTTPSAPATPVAPPTPTALPSGSASAGAAVWTSAGCGNCHSFNELRGNVGADLNTRHPGPFDNGQLTPQQIADLIAYINSR